MAIHQTHRQTDLEKRLKILRQQFYGKNQFRVQSVQQGEPLRGTNYQLPTTNSLTDTSYLNQDLLKILTFSSVALGVQIILKITFF